MLGAWLIGPLLLSLVFGSQFSGSAVFLLAGSAFAVLLFADQAVDMLILANNLPWLLAVKWGVALFVALLVFWRGFAGLGAMVGPVGLASGVAMGWLALLSIHLVRARRVRAARLSASLKDAS